MRKKIELFGLRMKAAVQSHPVEVSLSVLACAMGCYDYESEGSFFDMVLQYMPVVFLFVYTLNRCCARMRRRLLYYFSALLWIPFLMMPVERSFSSIVPVGLTKYRDGLYPLEPFTKEDAREVLSVIHRWQEKIYQEHGIHMIHAGDEWYVLAEEEVPEEARYDGYLQLENGVGMMRLLFNEVQEALSAVTGDGRQREISLATGRLMYPYIGKILEEIRKKFPNITTHLYAIRNDFFGERITVSGLITGQDLTGQLKGQPLGERLLLPCNMLKIGEPVFLDDFTLEEVENSLQVKTDIVKSSGQDLLDAVIGVYENDDFSTDRRRGRFQEM